ncbi:hypothetical protein L4C31_18245, partial [Aliivibrio sifiae]
MSKLNNWLIKRVLKRVVSQSCPDKIPRSGKAGAEVRCYSTVIKKLGKEELFVTGFDGHTIFGLQYDQDRDNFIEPASIDVHWIKASDFDIRRYIGYFEVTYTDLWDFIRNDSTGYMAARALLYRLRSNISQYMFNRRTLELKKRHELLSFLIRHYGSLRSEFSLISLMHKVYSANCFRHPDQQKLKLLLELQLDSFIRSGELEKSKNGYKVTGQSILTLETFQLEHRRYRKMVVQQWLMIILT